MAKCSECKNTSYHKLDCGKRRSFDNAMIYSSDVDTSSSWSSSSDCSSSSSSSSSDSGSSSCD